MTHERHFESQPRFLRCDGQRCFVELMNGRVAEISSATYSGLCREAATYEPPLEVLSDPVDACAACGQVILTTPDDPPATLLCDVCLASLERRRALRPGTIAANPPQGGLF